MILSLIVETLEFSRISVISYNIRSIVVKAELVQYYHKKLYSDNDYCARECTYLRGNGTWVPRGRKASTDYYI